MWLCKLFGHKYHQWLDGMRSLFCERCGYSLTPMIHNEGKEKLYKFDGFTWHKMKEEQ